ncbi:hypothetical protein ACJX0J_007055 [Zea mays]
MNDMIHTILPFIQPLLGAPVCIDVSQVVRVYYLFIIYLLLLFLPVFIFSFQQQQPYRTRFKGKKRPFIGFNMVIFNLYFLAIGWFDKRKEENDKLKDDKKPMIIYNPHVPHKEERTNRTPIL